jgi:hypothetical protein
MMSLQSTTLKGCTINGMPLRSTKRVVVLRAEPKETSTGQDSYSKIEAPVRDSIPDGGKPVSERNWGQEELNPALKADEALKPLGSDISAADAMRFAGAIPEVANSRLAMLGVFAALIAEKTTGLNVFQQWSAAPLPIIGFFCPLDTGHCCPSLQGNPQEGQLPLLF